MDFRLIGYGAWALGSLLAWGAVLHEDIREYRMVRRKDRRSQSAAKEVVSDFALLLVAITSAASIAALLVGQDIPGFRGFMLATALGAFLGAGIVKATFQRRR